MGSLRVQGRKTKKTSQKSPPNKSSAGAAASTKTAAVIHGIPRTAHVPRNADLSPPRNKAGYEGNKKTTMISKGPYLFRGRKSFFKTGETIWVPKTFNSPLLSAVLGWEHENSSVVFSSFEADGPRPRDRKSIATCHGRGGIHPVHQNHHWTSRFVLKSPGLPLPPLKNNVFFPQLPMMNKNP